MMGVVFYLREASMSKDTKPNDKITVTVDEIEREIFISFNLVNELAKLIGSPDNIPYVYVDGELRDKVLKSVLAKRKKSGKIIDAVDDLDEVDLSMDDAENLLGWVAEHVLGFFVRSLTRVNALTEAHKVALEQLGSSLVGQTD
jgi:hypothetical protein